MEAGEADALIHLIWIAPGSGVYGEMRRVIIDDRPRAFVYVTPAIDGQGPAIARLAARDPLLRDTIVYLTCVHELGHAVGLPHTAEFEDIMYSFAFGGDIVRYFMRYRDKLDSRADIMNHSGLSPSDRAVLHGLYPLQNDKRDREGEATCETFQELVHCVVGKWAAGWQPGKAKLSRCKVEFTIVNAVVSPTTAPT